MVRKLFQVLQYGEIILQKPEEETQGQTIVFTSISQIMEFVLTSKCVGVIFEWLRVYNMRASEACEPCEADVRGVRAMRGMRARHARHARQA